MTLLGTLAIASVGRARVRRKAFDVVRALGGDRDLAARVAGEISDAARWLDRHARDGRVDVSLAADERRLAVVFGFAWSALANGAADPPAAIRGADRVPAQVSYALRGATATPEAVAQARTVLASRSRDELFAGLEASNEALLLATAEAKQASAAKAQFLANMSHEIRTPMNAIIGMNRLALATELTPLQRGHLEKVEASSRHLLAVVDDVLDVSKIEAGKVVLEQGEVVVRRVLDDVTTLTGGACADKGLGLTVDVAGDVPATVLGDALRLRQVLVNLVTNAVKFTERGGVRVAVTRHPTRADEVGLRFAVRDSGIGLDEAQQRRLFQAFTQADPTITRRYGGTGLGLAISKSLVELMHGEIGVESRPGAGSTFWFTARFGRARLGPELDERGRPAGATAAAAGAAAAGAPPRLDPSARILMVEDNALNQEVASGLLLELGLAATVVGDGRAALEALRRDGFDLVLMDVQMPVMDGMTATRRIRADARLRDLPVIAMTAGALAGDREACLAAGMNAVVTKPIDADDLRRALAAWLPARGSAARAERGAGAARAAPDHGTASAPQGTGTGAATHADHAAASADRLPRGVPGLDVDRGLRFTRGRPDLYLKILRGFLDDQRDLPANLHEALARDDLALAARLAHTLRGLASGLGAHALSAAAEAFEAAARSGETRARVEAAAAVLVDRHAQLFTALDAFGGGGARPASLRTSG